MRRPPIRIRSGKRNGTRRAEGLWRGAGQGSVIAPIFEEPAASLVDMDRHPRQIELVRHGQAGLKAIEERGHIVCIGGDGIRSKSAQHRYVQ